MGLLHFWMFYKQRRWLSSRWFFQWYLYSKELWNIQVASPPRATSRHALLLSITESLGFSGGSDGKESTCNEGDLDSIPGGEDPLEEVMATHSSILPWRIPMDREAWRTTVYGIAKSQTQLSAMQAHACVHAHTHTHKHTYTARKSKVLCFWPSSLMPSVSTHTNIPGQLASL